MLEIITSPLLTARHGYFTRKGGASSGIFAGLNCGTGSSDQREIVEINRARVANAMKVEPGHLVSLLQVHSATVIALTGPPGSPAQADGMVTATPGIALGILTADCQPVLFCDPKAKVIGATHAGWRGAKMGVLEATVVAMESLGSRRENIRAAIGPTISHQAYDVGQEFFEEFTVDDQETTRFFAQGQNGKYLFDLPAYGLHRLRDAGVGVAEWTGHCTYRDPERFFSYRRTTHLAEVDYGRLISVIRL